MNITLMCVLFLLLLVLLISPNHLLVIKSADNVTLA